MTEVVVRQMELTDIDDVMAVETESFTAPWPKDVILHELTNNQYAHYYVILLDQQVVGYSGLWHVIDDAQITNIAIAPTCRGKKLGETLFFYTLEAAIKLGAKRLSLEVRVSNTIAQRMYRKFGLVPGGIRKNYYTDDQEDAIVMWVNLS
ncbi:ribosomal protein S18-alanine N-acetyltransferase [Lentibacillus amyloliquefaciens]|uniref:[Ribosomal protein bS18]-alanine N-acetyltransferase n=1 Tax=Lentibacillus amyloliquefaciens TaxID=1472767 RepID=A0A0U4EF03_9BACI|nr:ribosomal protein S18-alanine N-acetyltransferase [Lentibacillus amyloliquefaciens]ALX49129.1 ribosomal-protein-alanine acetyltransferase [Lentibacillus amyloliquefaciens]